MIIESIRLKNIKSYDGEGYPIDFRHGVNLIWGENGSGKTTILEAIGFCLFDALDYNLGQFIREGEPEGEVVLTFKHQDGRSYAIVREIRNTGGLKIRDAATGRDLITKRKDAEDWLNEQLGIEFGKYGRDLFQNAIGVAQGMMTGAFAVSPGARKKIFDPILRVDEYDQAYKKLVDTKNHLDNMLHDAQREQSHMSGCLEQLPPTKKRFQDLFEQIRVGERDLEMAQEQIDSLREEMSVLDETLRKLGELDAEISTASNTLASLARQLETAEASFEEARLANEIVIATRWGHEMYDQAKKELAELDIRQIARNRLLEEVQAVDLAISRLVQQISGLKRDLAEVEAAEKKIVELEPDVDKQTECEFRRNTALDQLKERDRSLRNIEELNSRIQEKKNSLEALDLQLIQRTELDLELREKSIERDDVLSGLHDIGSGLSQIQTERETLVQQLQNALLEKQSWETVCKQRDDLTAEIEKDKQNLDRLEKQVQERDQLEQEQVLKDREKEDCLARLTEIQQESALCNHKLDELKNHLSLLRSAEGAECPVCRRSLSDLERDHVETDFIKDEQTWLQRQGTSRTDESSTKTVLQQIDRRLHEIQSRLKKLPLETQVTELRALIADKNYRLEGLIEQINASAGVNKTVTDLQSRNDELGASRNALMNQKETLEGQRNLLDQAIALINQEIALLPTDAIKKATEEEIDDLDRRIAMAVSAVEKLGGAEQDLENARIELEMLGDPRTELNRLSGIASRRSALEEEYRASEGEKVVCSENHKKLSNQLIDYTTLEQEIGDKKSVLLETEQDYRNYERNVQLAQTLEARQVRVGELRQQHIDQVTALNGLQIEKSRVGDGYDPVYHRDMRQDLDRLSTSATTLCAQLGEWQKQFELVGKEISSLEQLQEQYREKENEVDRLEKLKGTFDFVRNSIKRASPEIVNKRVQAISLTADRIFQDILGDLMLTLTWDEAYTIKVHTGQKERVFEQLSGGEQMAASIAVRLALLLHMSDRNIRWLFLDEPTANMDDKRRDKLADRITRLEQLDQIFVITHDDAFDRDTHHLIQISKFDGVSAATIIR